MSKEEAGKERGGYEQGRDHMQQVSHTFHPHPLYFSSLVAASDNAFSMSVAY